MQGSKRRWLPAAIVVTLFLAMGALVVLALQLRPKPWGLPPDPLEKRLDRENNAWYTLEEARELFGAEKAPHGLNATVEWLLREPQEYAVLGRVWQKVEGYPGQRLDTLPVEQHEKLMADLRAYVKRLEPALDKLCEAAEKPWCLQPPGPKDGPVYLDYYPGTNVMASALINSAVTMSREGRADKASRYVQAWLRLTRFVGPDTATAHCPVGWNYAAEALRRATPPQQDEMLAWLIRFRQEWKPPIDVFIAHLRLLEQSRLKPLQNLDETLTLYLKKRFLRTRAPACIEVAGMTLLEADRFRARHPEYYQAVSFGLFNWPQFNSRVLTGLDGLTLMLAIEKYKRGRGAYPAALDELAPGYVPQAPADSFSNAPFVYRTSEDGYALYSKGLGVHRNSLSDVTVFNAWPGFEF